MSFHSFVLYTHVVATLGLFAGLGIEWLILVGLKKTVDATQARAWIEYWPQVLRLMMASVLLVVTSGIYLAAGLALWKQGWIEVSLASLLIIAPLSAVGARKMRVARKEIFDGRSGHLGGVSALTLSLSCRTALALGVVMLMTTKTNQIESIVIIGVAGMAGLVLGMALLNGKTARPEYEAGRFSDEAKEEVVRSNR